jgi:1-deoxy-D-xylulose-5-phosphate reductoisomerase
METPAQRLDLTAIGRLDFEAPDPQRFPALRLARSALEAGGSATIVLNAANEIAVRAFLDGRIGFADICVLVERALDAAPLECSSIDDVIEIDRRTRTTVEAMIEDANVA